MVKTFLENKNNRHRRFSNSLSTDNDVVIIRYHLGASSWSTQLNSVRYIKHVLETTLSFHLQKITAEYINHVKWECVYQSALSIEIKFKTDFSAGNQVFCYVASFMPLKDKTLDKLTPFENRSANEKQWDSRAVFGVLNIVQRPLQNLTLYIAKPN